MQVVHLATTSNQIENWISQKKALEKELARYRLGSLIMDCCLVLQHLIDKHASRPKSKLLATVNDFGMMFDSMSYRSL